jgi:energy-coupling factor transport system substrate-specific component
MRKAETPGLLVITLAGLAIFSGPLAVGRTFPQSAALFAALIACAALVLVAIGLQTQRLSTRLLAVLAALVAIDASLRLVVVIGLLGFSPIFFLIIMGGFAMGPSFGFALGSLTLLLSAALTAGFGPWLPYQMLACGWVGMGAGWLGSLKVVKRHRWLLAVYGCLAGFGYGLLLDLWEWPFLLAAGSSAISWAPGLSLMEMARRFGLFYLTTSLVYDGFRAAGNVVLIALLGKPISLALDRFRRRFLVSWNQAGWDQSRSATNIAGDVGTPA